MSKVLRRRTILPITNAATALLALFSTAYACTGLALGIAGTLTVQPSDERHRRGPLDNPMDRDGGIPH